MYLRLSGFYGMQSVYFISVNIKPCLKRLIYTKIRQRTTDESVNERHERHADYRAAEDTYTYKAEPWATFFNVALKPNVPPYAFSLSDRRSEV